MPFRTAAVAALGAGAVDAGLARAVLGVLAGPDAAAAIRERRLGPLAGR